MTEILTESFCERCGTRYTFESVAPRQKRMGGIRVLGRGLRNFVLSDDSSLDEAMAEARSDSEREATAQQLDAFHRTFNFCMSCRQYTCGNCWNGVEARCLSCAPMAGAEPAVAPPEESVDLERLMRLAAPPAETAGPATAEPEPELIGLSEIAVHADTPAAAPEGVDGVASIEAAEAPGPVAAEAVEAEAVEAPAAEAPAAEAVEAPEWWRIAKPATPEPVTAEPAAEPVAEEPLAAEEALRGLEAGESLEDAIAAYEAAQAAGTPEAPTVGAGPGVDVVEQPTWPASLAPVEREAPPAEVAEEEAAAEVAEPPVEVAPVSAEPEPSPAAAEVAAPPVEVAPVSAEPEPSPAAAEVAEPEPEPIAAAAAAPIEPMPAPEAPAPAPAVPPAAAPPAPAGVPSGPPQWPTGPRWPTGIPARQTLPPPTPAPGPVADPLAAIMARQATEAMWAASSRDVVQPPLVAQAAPVAGVQPCISCGISLSANARFCRRCGTSQVG